MAVPEFIPKSGACLVSKNVVSGAGRVRWVVREEIAGIKIVGTVSGREVPPESLSVPPSMRARGSSVVIVGGEPASQASPVS